MVQKQQAANKRKAAASVGLKGGSPRKPAAVQKKSVTKRKAAASVGPKRGRPKRQATQSRARKLSSRAPASNDSQDTASTQSSPTAQAPSTNSFQISGSTIYNTLGSISGGSQHTQQTGNRSHNSNGPRNSRTPKRPRKDRNARQPSTTSVEENAGVLGRRRRAPAYPMPKRASRRNVGPPSRGSLRQSTRYSRSRSPIGHSSSSELDSSPLASSRRNGARTSQRQGLRPLLSPQFQPVQSTPSQNSVRSNHSSIPSVMQPKPVQSPKSGDSSDEYMASPPRTNRGSQIPPGFEELAKQIAVIKSGGKLSAEGLQIADRILQNASKPAPRAKHILDRFGPGQKLKPWKDLPSTGTLSEEIGAQLSSINSDCVVAENQGLMDCVIETILYILKMEVQDEAIQVVRWLLVEILRSSPSECPASYLQVVATPGKPILFECILELFRLMPEVPIVIVCFENSALQHTTVVPSRYPLEKIDNFQNWPLISETPERAHIVLVQMADTVHHVCNLDDVGGSGFSLGAKVIKGPNLLRHGVSDASEFQLPPFPEFKKDIANKRDIILSEISTSHSPQRLIDLKQQVDDHLKNLDLELAQEFSKHKTKVQAISQQTFALLDQKPHLRTRSDQLNAFENFAEKIFHAEYQKRKAMCIEHKRYIEVQRVASDQILEQIQRKMQSLAAPPSEQIFLAPEMNPKKKKKSKKSVSTARKKRSQASAATDTATSGDTTEVEESVLQSEFRKRRRAH